MKEKTMTVVMMEPGKPAYITQIENSLKAMQAVVGGRIQVVYPFADSVAIVCNEEGKRIGLPPNRALFLDQKLRAGLYDYLVGNAFVCGQSESEEELCSLTEEQQVCYLKMFGSPDSFTVVLGDIGDILD